MKIAIIVARILLGLVYVAASITYFLKLAPVQEMTGPVKTFTDGINAAPYMMPTIKGIELIFGLALIIGRFVPLSAVVLFPITLNIFLFHAFLGPETLVVAIVLLALNLFLAYAYRDRYKPMLSAK